MKKHDLLTGESFYPKRITQNFANAENRILYYNRKANSIRHSVMYINTPLHKNLKILNEIMDDKEKGVFHKQFLEGKNYSLDVMTHFDSYNNKRVACIYHYAIINIEDEKVTFIKIKPKNND